MCNRFWALTPILAYALHRKQKLFVLFARKDYLDCFPQLKKCNNVYFLFCHNNPRPNPLEWRVGLLSERFNLEVHGELRNLDRINFLTFINGWQHSCDKSFIQEHKKEIVKLFEPSCKIVNKVNCYFEEYDGITIGVHIRRGDYKNYLDGKYYFEDDIYIRAINSMRNELENECRQVRFLICSNEPCEMSDNCDDVFSIKSTDGVTDLYALTRCDYIIGPPSSYSQWASFVGDVPLCFILSPNFIASKGHFSSIVSFNRFANNKELIFDEKKQEYYII